MGLDVIRVICRCCSFVPAEPAASGQADHRVPFIPGLHLSMQNRQFVALLKAASFGAIVSTTVNLLPLFFQFVMGVAEADVDEIYALYVKAVVAVAFLTILAVQPLNRHLGRIAVLRLGVVAGMCYGLLALVLSFTSVSSFYLTTVPAGIFAGIVMVNGEPAALDCPILEPPLLMEEAWGMAVQATCCSATPSTTTSW